HQEVSVSELFLENLKNNPFKTTSLSLRYIRLGGFYCPDERNIFMSQKQSNELFYPHYIMTDSEYGVWNYARSVSHQTKVFQCGARAIAARFKSMSKSTASRRINGLIKSGWFDVIEPAK